MGNKNSIRAKRRLRGRKKAFNKVYMEERTRILKNLEPFVYVSKTQRRLQFYSMFINDATMQKKIKEVSKGLYGNGNN